MSKTYACLTVMMFLVLSQYAVAAQPALFAADAEQLSAAILDPSAYQVAFHIAPLGRFANTVSRLWGTLANSPVPGPAAVRGRATSQCTVHDGRSWRESAGVGEDVRITLGRTSAVVGVVIIWAPQSCA